jgi:pyruvate formate lyase activating enzyme
MITTGIVFDIREFTVHDGPGLRTTVFLKGCPLACQWCHNPEGQASQPQVIRSPAGERLAGRIYTAAELAALLNKQVPVLTANEGGLTFSGGEPLLQAEFVAAVIDQLDEAHVLLDTSGYGPEDSFRRLLARVDLVYFDLKLINSDQHRHYTGCDNDLILRNLRVLSISGKPFVIRVPLVPGVTDTVENLVAIAQAVGGLPGLQTVDLLPYNKVAGAKYRAAGMEFKPDYDETQEVNADTRPFEQAGIEVQIL